MRKWLKIYFDFSKREFNGLLVLVGLIALLSAIPYIYEWVLPEKENVKEEIAALQKLLLIESRLNKRSPAGRNWSDTGKIPSEDPGKLKPFNFDPNHTTVQQWQQLGLSAAQARVMVRYTGKGGQFNEKEDLQKMYVISPETYERLAPYIEIDKEALREKRRRDPGMQFKPGYSKMPQLLKSPMAVIALHSADTIELDQVKGIGPAFARRIFKYRTRLGGFYKKEQLLEVYGMDSIKYKEIRDQLSLDPRQISQIYINRVGFEELRTHPYLDFKQINAILQYRKQHGNYLNIADLKKVLILPAATVEKLAPYISFEHD